MLHNRESYLFLPLPFVLALCGIAFCAWNLWSGQSPLCITTGCELFSDFTLGGFSLWWAGISGFVILALLALAGRPALGKLGAGIGLLLDCILLIILLMSAPCLPCLVVAVLLALCYLSFRMACQAQRRPNEPSSFSILLALWSCLFIANIGCLVRDSLDPWAMQTAGRNAAHAYVSPSCPACRQLVRELPEEQAENLTWYPIAENEQDVRVIAALVTLLNGGESLSQAFPKALENPADGRWDLLRPDVMLLQLRLWRNQAHVMSRGGTLPLVEFSGLPAFMIPARPVAAEQPNVESRQQRAATPRPAPSAPAAGSDGFSSQGEFGSPDLPITFDIAGQCGPGQEPCE